VRRDLLEAHIRLPAIGVVGSECLRLDFDACRGRVRSVLGDAHVVRGQVNHRCVVSPNVLSSVEIGKETVGIELDLDLEQSEERKGSWPDHKPDEFESSEDHENGAGVQSVLQQCVDNIAS